MLRPGLHEGEGRGGMKGETGYEEEERERKLEGKAKWAGKRKKKNAQEGIKKKVG